MKKSNKTCPECGSKSVARISYGLPCADEEQMKERDEGKIVFGGCCVCNESPAWHCNDCEHEWGKYTNALG
mgnify:CR=1 FL=1